MVSVISSRESSTRVNPVSHDFSKCECVVPATRLSHVALDRLPREASGSKVFRHRFEPGVRVRVGAARVDVHSGFVQLGPGVDRDVGLREEEKGGDTLRLELVRGSSQNSSIRRLRRQRHGLKDLRLIVKQPRVLRRDIGDDVSGNGAQLRLSPCSAGDILPLRVNLCHNSLCYR
jgi:hypothetical protein